MVPAVIKFEIKIICHLERIFHSDNCHLKGTILLVLLQSSATRSSFFFLPAQQTNHEQAKWTIEP